MMAGLPNITIFILLLLSFFLSFKILHVVTPVMLMYFLNFPVISNFVSLVSIEISFTILFMHYLFGI